MLYLIGLIGLVIAGLIYFLVRQSKEKGKLEERQFADDVVAEQIRKAHEEDINADSVSTDDKRDRMQTQFTRE